jgi:predicted dehydrogenase
MARIRIGIIGTGGMANAHADNLKKLPGVALASCLDVVPGSAEAFAAKHHIPHTAASLGALLKRVDAVAIVTPDKVHAKYCLAALKAGKHVLCEKPLTVTLAEARRLAHAERQAARRGLITMVHFSYRRSAAMQRAMHLAKRGVLGDLRHVHSHYLQGWLRGVQEPKGGALWRLQTATGGGVLGDLGCHLLDLTTAVAGEVRRVRCAFGNWPKLNAKGRPYTTWKGARLDANDTALIELEFANGALGAVHTTRWALGRGNHIRVEAHGTEGALMFDLDRSYEQLDVFTRKGQKWETVTLKPAPTIWQRWIKAIKSGKPDQPDLTRGAQVQAYLDACARSVASGKWEQVRAWR